MTPYKRNGRYYLYVPRQAGGVVLRATGTKDPLVYRGMKRMLAELKDARRWTLLRAVDRGTLTLGRLYDAHTSNALGALEASLSASALAPHITAYLTSCKGRGLAPRNVENIKRQLDAFLTVAATTADLTTATVTAWLASLKTSPGTRRQYLYAVTGFTRYLVDEVEVLKDYPLARVKAPKKNQPRMSYVDAATDERIVQAASPQYRALFAFIKGTGCDVSTALAVLAWDFNLYKGTVRLKGTKTAQRDVHNALIEGWATRYVHARVGEVIGNVPLFPFLTRSGAYHHHARCCEAVGVTGYTLKDSRHSVAVRMMEAGYNVQEIAEQLGNSPELVARVYTRVAPKMTRRATPGATEAKNA